MTLQGPMKPKEHRAGLAGLASQGPPDWSSWPGHDEGIFSSATETLGILAFEPMEKHCHSPPGTYGQNSDFTAKIPNIKGLFP